MLAALRALPPHILRRLNPDNSGKEESAKPPRQRLRTQRDIGKYLREVYAELDRENREDQFDSVIARAYEKKEELANSRE